MKVKKVYVKSYANYMKAFLAFLVVVLMSSTNGYAQKKIRHKATGNVIAGVVVDEELTPLSGVYIRIEGSSLGAVSKSDGSFSVSRVPSGNVIITASFMGMKEFQQSVEVPLKAPLTITMYESTTELSELVVVAKSNINKIDIRERSGVVDIVDMKKINNIPVQSIALALQGAVPGLVITTTGELGTKPTIRLRGNSSFIKDDYANEPLYVLDGKVISSSTFFLLNPQDIEEIKVLKDAAACVLYGINAANGVLEITSKKGYNGPISISYSADIGVASKGNRSLRMMGTEEKLAYERLLKEPWTPGYILSPEFINNASLNDLHEVYGTLYGTPRHSSKDGYLRDASVRLDSLRTINTDWFDTLMRTTMYHNHYLSVRGGNDEVSYYSSVSYSHQEGQLPDNSSTLFSGRLGVVWQLSKNNYVSLQTGATYNKIKTPNGASTALSELVYNLNPYESPESKYLYSYPGRGYKELFGQYVKEEAGRSGNASLSINLKPLKGLSIDAVLGVDYRADDEERRTLSTSFVEANVEKAPISQRGHITKAKRGMTDITANLRMTYFKKWAEKHDLTLSLNYDYYYHHTNNLSATGYGTGRLNFLGSANMSIEGVRKPTFDTYKQGTAQRGAGFALGYSYDEKYDFFSALKVDQSSVLPPQHKTNYAWAVGIGFNWDRILSINNDLINRVNTRFSYGKTANIGGVSISETVPVFHYGTSYYDDNRSLYMERIYNPNLKAEQTTSYDAGLSFNLLGKTNLSLQWYYRLVDDAILDMPLASSHGYLSMKKNIGSLMNQGVEVSIDQSILTSENISLRLRASVAYNENKVVSLYGGETSLYSSSDQMIPDYRVGESYSLIWGLEALGVNPVTGYMMVRGGDGTEKSIADRLTGDDFKVLGKATPPVTGSFGGAFKYHSFELDFSLYYSLGGKKPYSYTYIRQKGYINKNLPEGVLERTWFQLGDENKIYPYPFMSQDGISNLHMYANSAHIASTNYLRLSDVSLRYYLPPTVVERLTSGIVKYASIAIRGSNLFTLTPYSDGSPEAGSVAVAVQPIYTFNINVTL